MARLGVVVVVRAGRRSPVARREVGPCRVSGERQGWTQEGGGQNRLSRESTHLGFVRARSFPGGLLFETRLGRRSAMKKQWPARSRWGWELREWRASERLVRLYVSASHGLVSSDMMATGGNLPLRRYLGLGMEATTATVERCKGREAGRCVDAGELGGHALETLYSTTPYDARSTSVCFGLPTMT